MSYSLATYNPPYDGDILERDIVKISIDMIARYGDDGQTRRVIEHIWTEVEHVDGDVIRAKISNRLTYEPITGSENLILGETIVFNRVNIRDLKRNTVETKEKKIKMLTALIRTLPEEIITQLSTMTPEQREKFFENM